MERLHRADLELTARSVEQVEQRSCDATHLAAGRSEPGRERNEAAEDIGAIGVCDHALQELIAMRLEPFRMAAGGFLDDVGGASPDDGVLVVESVGEICN